MSKEEKSVRSQVTAIEERTAKLDSVLEKLSDSLDRISESLAKQQPTDNDQPDRQELIKQFKQPFATPQAVTKEGSSDDLLNDIKDSLVLSQKDNFKLFKSIEETLLRIEQMGGSLGGGDGFTCIGILPPMDERGIEPLSLPACLLGYGRSNPFARPIAGLSRLSGRFTFLAIKTRPSCSISMLSRMSPVNLITGSFAKRHAHYS